MHNDRSHLMSDAAIGALAGLAGTAIMFAMRSFDEKYAPKTMPKISEDPGQMMFDKAARATGLQNKIPKPIKKVGPALVHIGYGTMAGVLYGAVCGHQKKGSSLLKGALMGTAVYAAGYAGWLPFLRITRPLWKQPMPKIAGEVFRHIAYGITTAAVQGAINARR